MSALFRLEDIGVPVITSLNTKFQPLQQTLSMYNIPNIHNYTNPISLLKAWLSHGMSTPPSWKNLLQIVRYLHLDDLAQGMETCLYKGTGREDLCSDSGVSEAEFVTENESDHESEG